MNNQLKLVVVFLLASVCFLVAPALLTVEADGRTLALAAMCFVFGMLTLQAVDDSGAITTKKGRIDE